MESVEIYVQFLLSISFTKPNYTTIKSPRVLEVSQHNLQIRGTPTTNVKSIDHVGHLNPERSELCRNLNAEQQMKSFFITKQIGNRFLPKYFQEMTKITFSEAAIHFLLFKNPFT